MMLEVRAGRGVELDRKLVGSDPRERGRQLVDRVDPLRPRAVSPNVRSLQREVLVDLLARLNSELDRTVVFIQQAARALVERELRAKELGAVLEQPDDAVVNPRGLLTAGEGEGDGPERTETFLAVANQAVGEDRGHRLVVARATRVEKAVLLDQLERVAFPVRALRLDDVDVREQKNRVQPRFAALESRDQVAVL